MNKIIHCPTKELAKKVMKKESLNKWNGHGSYDTMINDMYKHVNLDELCIELSSNNDFSYSGLQYYKKENKIIINSKEFLNIKPKDKKRKFYF